MSLACTKHRCDIAVISSFAHMILFCLNPWPYKLKQSYLAAKCLMFSVPPSTYSVIHSKKYASIWENFNHVFEVFQSLFFVFLFQRKDALGMRMLLYDGFIT